MNLALNIRRFYGLRHEDASGVSGLGIVFEGVTWSDGKCAIRFISPTGSTNIFDSIEAVKAVHGHAGMTDIVFMDPDPNPTITTEHVAEKEAEPVKVTKRGKKAVDK